MHTRTARYTLTAAGLVVSSSAMLLGAIVTFGKAYPLLVMVAAAIGWASVALQDRSLTAEEKRTRVRLRETMP